MGPLFLANWRLIHRRFCLLAWVVATALAVVILVHLAAASAACARRYAPRASACATHLPVSQPLIR
jgi:hypothetical protein